MDYSIRLSFLIEAMACIVPAVVCIAVFSGPLIHLLGKSARLAHRGVFSGVTPGFLLLGLFYSLAWHMHQSLAEWPISTGERGFSTGLLVHVRMVSECYWIVLLTTLFVWPVAFAVCGLYRPWRRGTIYLSIYVLCLAFCIFLMSLAPLRFLDWWVD